MTRLDASVEWYDDRLVALLAEVATAYTDLRTFQQRLAYARSNVESQEQSLGDAPIPTSAPDVVAGIPADLSGLSNGSQSLAGNFGPYFRWDLLNYGRLTSLIDIEDARFEQLLWAYQEQVLVAGREAEDGPISCLRSQERVRNLEASALAAEHTLYITKDQYRQGVVDFTPVFLASSVLAGQQDKMAAAQGAKIQGLIALYRALGGGWEIRLNRGTRMNQIVGNLAAAYLSKNIFTMTCKLIGVCVSCWS